jgi:hypothetical protein
MRKLTKPSPTVSPLLFELDPGPLQETLTALGGIPLVVQAFRSLGLPQSIQEHVRVKQRQRGYDEATFVESFVILNAAGGECVEDFERLRQDPGLAEMIGHGLPSPRAALEFLQAFHQEEKIEEAKQQRLPEQIAYIPDETPAQEGLGRVNGDLVRHFGERTPDQRIATVDQDATIIESHKQQALTTYEGVRGYQPMLAAWAGTGLVLADEFRDGNVPAHMEPLAVAQRAFAALPGTVGEYYYRGDSACHESGLVNWLRDEQRSSGPRGRIGFAISARMSEPLHAAIKALPEAAWETYGESHPAEIRECADVPFVPSEKVEKKDSQPLRYVEVGKRLGCCAFHHCQKGPPPRQQAAEINLIKLRRQMALRRVSGDAGGWKLEIRALLEARKLGVEKQDFPCERIRLSEFAGTTNAPVPLPTCRLHSGALAFARAFATHLLIPQAVMRPRPIT